MNILRPMTRGAYDIQKLRIETGNRIAANWRAKMGVENKLEDDAEATKVLDEVLLRFRRITDGIIEITRRRKYDYDGVISSYSELSMIANYLQLLKQEKRQFRDLEGALAGIPVYEEFLKGVKGCGPAMSAVIISEFDITKAKYASSLWRYAGLDVARDGRGRSSRKEHLVDVEYTDKNGETQTKKSLTHNRFLKTKLVGVLGPSFLRAGDHKYSRVYYDYKHRLENHPVHAEKTKLHRHNMAIRYMVKLFLADLYQAWRVSEDLPVHAPFHEAKLGYRHAA